MAVSDGEAITVMKDMGLVTTVFDERKLSGLRGHLAIGHTRYSTAGSSDWMQRPAGLPGSGPGRVRPRPQRQSDQHGGAGRRGRHAARHGVVGQRPGGRAAGPGHSRPTPSTSTRPRRSTISRHALVSVLPSVEGAFSFVLLDADRLIGVRDPNGFRPLCLGRLEPPTSSRGLGAGLRVARPRRHRGHVHPRARARRDGRRSTARRCARSGPSPPSGSTRSSASSSSSTSPGPTPRSTGTRCTAPAGAWASCWPRRRPVAGRSGHGRARLGRPRRRGLRRGHRHPLRPGPGQEPLHRPDLHRPHPGRTGQRGAPQAQPAPREHRRQAAHRGRRLDRPGHDHPGHGHDAARVRARVEVHLRISSPPFRWPCFYGIDTPDRTELLAADQDHRARSPSSSTSTPSSTSPSTTWSRPSTPPAPDSATPA